MGSGQNPLDSFFPFDPYLLRRSFSHVQPFYTDWADDDDSHSDDSSHSDSDSDSEDDDNDHHLDGAQAMSLTSVGSFLVKEELNMNVGSDCNTQDSDLLTQRTRAASIGDGSW